MCHGGLHLAKAQVIPAARGGNGKGAQKRPPGAELAELTRITPQREAWHVPFGYRTAAPGPADERAYGR